MVRGAANRGLGSADRRLDEDVIGTADQKKMFGVVAPHNDELALAVEVEDIDNVEAARAVAASRGADTASE